MKGIPSAISHTKTVGRQSQPPWKSEGATADNAAETKPSLLTRYGAVPVSTVQGKLDTPDSRSARQSIARERAHSRARRNHDKDHQLCVGLRMGAFLSREETKARRKGLRRSKECRRSGAGHQTNPQKHPHNTPHTTPNPKQNKTPKTRKKKTKKQTTNKKKP